MNEEIDIRIKRNPNIKEIEEINIAKGSIYPSNLVRIVLYGSMVEFVSKEGKTRAVESNYKNILFYGSSITGNCISLLPNNEYPWMVNNELKLNLINLGFPGSCRIEKEVVDQSVKINFEYAFLELGVNIIKEISVSQFKEKCTYLLGKISKLNKKVFVTDIYPYFNLNYGVSDEKLDLFRNSLKEITSDYKNIIYIPGYKLLKSKTNLCADLIHPDIDGHFEISRNLVGMIKEYLQK